MAGKWEIRLAVLAGDSIGPEITDATVKVVKAAADQAGLKIRLKRFLIAWRAYEKRRSTLPEHANSYAVSVVAQVAFVCGK